jgi:SAM-dependent methyltransferase
MSLIGSWSALGRRVRVELDCEAKYLSEDDPWGIGQADSERYNLYLDLIRTHTRSRGSVLDVGCGFGAMLARLQSDFERLHGIELSEAAVAKGAERYPFITFERGSIDALERTGADSEHFDIIIFSDVLYYVDEAAKRASLRWIAEHLRPGGMAFIAAYSPDARGYPTPSEIRTLVEREFVVETDQMLESEHLVLLARPRRRLVALTLDYETWQPVPAGRKIDWNADVFEPTAALLDACDAEGASLTIFAEMGEHAFLREHEPQIAARMEAQWRDAVQRGHEVQLHLHPNWLPELGARLEDGRYAWNEQLTRTDDHPDLVSLIGTLKKTLEQAIHQVDPSYEAVAYRAGGYEAQPFRRIAEALQANDMWCDSSVYNGGRRPGQYHDYTHPVDTHQPWFVSHVDPQLEAPPAERGIVELPVATFGRNERLTFDTEEGARFGERLLAAIEAERMAGPSIETRRIMAKARKLARSGYMLVRSHNGLVNRVIPRRLAHAFAEYPKRRLVDDEFYVVVGHSKADLDIPEIRRQLRLLREAGVELVGLSDMAELARGQLERRLEISGRSDAPQACRLGGSVEFHDRRGSEPHRPQSMIPLDRTQMLDLGCGVGAWSAHIAAEHPWLRVTGVDASERLIATARERHSSERVEFKVADFIALPFPDGAFDCIYTDDTLRHAFDLDGALAEAWRVLADGGVFLAAVSPDAYDAGRTVEEHIWKPSAADVRERLRHAGFVEVSIEEIDTYRLGCAPYPPAMDRMLYVRAWRHAVPLTPLERVDGLRHWTHERLDPSRPSKSLDPLAVLEGGYADGAGMALVLGEALLREGYDSSWITMVARDHPAGSGAELNESHEAIELKLPDHSVHVIDPMCDVRFPYELQSLIDDPTVADGVSRERDNVYVERRGDLYSTSFWYGRVVAVAVRRQWWAAKRFVPARWADRAVRPPYRALAYIRVRAWRAIRALGPVRLPSLSRQS